MAPVCPYILHISHVPFLRTEDISPFLVKQMLCPDRLEPYGIDECWLDVTRSSSLKGDGLLIAQEISRRMKSELGITVSVGVSFNKIFAKLGSDYKKPDAITTMYKSEFKQKAWSLPVADLLYVGKSTNRKLALFGEN